MKLVEAESTGPVEGDAALVTPPRPPHRRVSVSLLFTLTVLIGTVVTIYLVFPARHNVLVTEAVDVHRDPPAWDLAAPSVVELRAWMTGVVGTAPPLPGDGTAATVSVIGAARRSILNRAAAIVRVRIGSDEVTYLVQHARGIAPERTERAEGDLRAIAWRAGPYTVVAVGPDAAAASWRAALTRR
ncbi:MAG TPA: hypothetical protein VFP84_13090 [Kofleriaceae bacterium]|nr:hypothetical protein [Kofleriaceae bacterium]